MWPVARIIELPFARATEREVKEYYNYKIKKHVLTGIICGGTCTCVITTVVLPPLK
jgi:hypothetical protein